MCGDVSFILRLIVIASVVYYNTAVMAHQCESLDCEKCVLNDQCAFITRFRMPATCIQKVDIHSSKFKSIVNIIEHCGKAEIVKSSSQIKTPAPVIRRTGVITVTKRVPPTLPPLNDIRQLRYGGIMSAVPPAPWYGVNTSVHHVKVANKSSLPSRLQPPAELELFSFHVPTTLDCFGSDMKRKLHYPVAIRAAFNMCRVVDLLARLANQTTLPSSLSTWNEQNPAQAYTKECEYLKFYKRNCGRKFV